MSYFTLQVDLLSSRYLSNSMVLITKQKTLKWFSLSPRVSYVCRIDRSLAQPWIDYHFLGQKHDLNICLREQKIPKKVKFGFCNSLCLARWYQIIFILLVVHSMLVWPQLWSFKELVWYFIDFMVSFFIWLSLNLEWPNKIEA